MDGGAWRAIVQGGHKRVRNDLAAKHHTLNPVTGKHLSVFGITWVCELTFLTINFLKFKYKKIKLILKEINTEYSWGGLKLKLQYFSHLMQRADYIGRGPDGGKD